jgi:hypothetical protein
MRSATFLVIFSSLAVEGCRPPPPPAPMSLVIVAKSETGAPVAGVELRAASTVIARSDATGRANVEVTGNEGASWEISAHCPRGFRSPSEPLVIRRLAIGTPSVPEHGVTCHSTRHTLIVVVRADGGPDLPVHYLGKPVARTDRSGVAHVTLEMDVHERVELTLSTAGVDKIHPQNPSAMFQLGERDEIQFFDVTFRRDAPRKVAAPRAPVGPVEL